MHPPCTPGWQNARGSPAEVSSQDGDRTLEPAKLVERDVLDALEWLAKDKAAGRRKLRDVVRRGGKTVHRSMPDPRQLVAPAQDVLELARCLLGRGHHAHVRAERMTDGASEQRKNACSRAPPCPTWAPPSTIGAKVRSTSARFSGVSKMSPSCSQRSCRCAPVASSRSTISTKLGAGQPYTFTPASKSWMARVYAPVRTVSGVASTPTLRVRVELIAARAPGAMTPMTGTGRICCAMRRPAAVAVLQAMTMILTSCSASQWPAWSTKARTSSSERTPYGHRLVSPT